ncbi:chitinase-3-like protein 1 [Neocloeon triangulifer]|uniref:chitinase-3-like protein 1 n=1 Tax=Neocloeon triangulifer TaxID=2078957 RepID=UPI00286F3A80|nr:chitinase-3-like protein 1 [Neocloeon triangulifer]
MHHRNWLGVIFLLHFCEARVCRSSSGNTSVEQMWRRNENNVRYCIANCLGLTPEAKSKASKTCQFDSSWGRVQGCDSTFIVPKKSKFKLICNMELFRDLSIIIDTPKTSLCDMITLNIAVFNPNTSEMEVAPDRIANVPSTINWAKQLGIKILFNVGSWDAFVMHPKEITKLASDSNAQTTKFIESIYSLIKKFDLDGVYFAWCWPGCTQNYCTNDILRKKVSQFIRDLAQPLKDKGQLFTYLIPGNAAKAGITLGDYFSDIVDVVDFFIFESHLQSGDWAQTAEFNFNLKETKKVLSEYLAIVKSPRFRSKIMFTFQTWIFNYELVGASAKIGGTVIKNSQIKKFLGIRDWCKAVRDNTYDVVRNPETQNYAVKGNTLFAFDDVESIKAKVKYVMSFGSGVVITDMLYDDFTGDCGCGKMPFLRVIANTLKMMCDPLPCF